MVARPVAVARNIRGLATAVGLVLGSERIEVTLERSDEGRALHYALSSRSSRHRLGRPCLSFVDLSDGFPAYWAEPARQQIRTRWSQAQRIGMTFRAVTDPEERRRMALDLIEERTSASQGTRVEDWFLARHLDRTFIGLDSSGRCVALASVAVAGQSAYMTSAIATLDRQVSSTARYALHTYVVRTLAEQGVHQLWADGPLLMSSGLQRYQRLLGYRCATPKLRWGAQA